MGAHGKFGPYVIKCVPFEPLGEGAMHVGRSALRRSTIRLLVEHILPNYFKTFR